MKTTKETMKNLLAATACFKKQLTAGVRIEEAFRDDRSLLYRVYGSHQPSASQAVEVRMEIRYGDKFHLSMSYASGTFDSPTDAMAQAMAILTASNLMAQLQAMRLCQQV